MRESPTVIKTISLSIFMVLATIILFLVLAEVGLRVYLSTHTFYDVEMARYANALKIESSNPLVGHEHRPNSSLRVMNTDVSINSDGFRDDEYTVEKGQNERIILLGDSLTFGWGVEKNESFEHLLEKELNNLVPTEIINFAAGNYNTTQQVQLLMDKGLRYQPDKVFLFYFINDAEPVPEKSKHAWLANFRLATFFWSRIKALAALRSPADSFKTFYAKLYQDDQEGWKQTRDSFVQLKKLCDENDIKLKVVILPELHNLVDYTFKEEHALVMAHLEKSGISSLDITPYFSAETEPQSLWVSRDDAHPNARAHKLIADYSFKFLSM